MVGMSCTRCWEVFHVKQQGEYVWVDEVSGGGVILLSLRLYACSWIVPPGMLRGDVGRRVVYAMLGMFHVKQ
jgi:hypothetical protein